MSKDQSNELTRSVSAAICRTFLAADMTTEEVATRSGIAPERVVEIMSTTDGKIYVEEVARLAAIFDVSFAEWFESIGLDARNRVR